MHAAVIPAIAGIHSANLRKFAVYGLDSRFRGNDWRFERDPTPNDTTTGASYHLTGPSHVFYDAHRIACQEGRDLCEK